MDAVNALNSVNELTRQSFAIKMIAEQARSAKLIADMLQSVADQGKGPARRDTVTISPQAIELSRTSNGG
jgi:hypothetical protein